MLARALGMVLATGTGSVAVGVTGEWLALLVGNCGNGKILFEIFSVKRAKV